MDSFGDPELQVEGEGKKGRKKLNSSMCEVKLKRIRGNIVFNGVTSWAKKTTMENCCAGKSLGRGPFEHPKSNQKGHQIFIRRVVTEVLMMEMEGKGGTI